MQQRGRFLFGAVAIASMWAGVFYSESIPDETLKAMPVVVSATCFLAILVLCFVVPGLAFLFGFIRDWSCHE